MESLLLLLLFLLNSYIPVLATCQIALLLSAGDVVLFSRSPVGLHRQLKVFQNYGIGEGFVNCKKINNLQYVFQDPLRLSSYLGS